MHLISIHGDAQCPGKTAAFLEVTGVHLVRTQGPRAGIFMYTCTLTCVLCSVSPIIQCQNETCDDAQ